MLKVFVVSDATGGTAERLVRSAAVQFEGAAVRLVRRSHVLTPEQVRAMVQEAAAAIRSSSIRWRPMNCGG